MSDPEFQKQHRIPRVYLKHFGYKEGGTDLISIYDRTKNYSEHAPISDFSVTINEFDYPYMEPGARRHFENTSSRIESKYRTVVNTIENQKKLTKRHEDILRHFISSIICRSEAHRSFFKGLLLHPKGRDRFLSEITMFCEDDLTPLKLVLEHFTQDVHFNAVMGYTANHIVTVLRQFTCIVLRAEAGKGWFTSDNPVFINYQGNRTYIIPFESEIYLPLSKDLCLFMYHSMSPIATNHLRGLAANKVHQADPETFDTITKHLVTNSVKFLIFPGQFTINLNDYNSEDLEPKS